MTENTNVKGLSRAELEAWVANLQNENKTLKTSNGNIKVSAKGAVSVYGLGRFPVTLYKSQWDKLLGMTPAIQEFITANESRLAVKEKAA